MRIAFAGDWHLHLGWAPRAVEEAGQAGAELLIHLGDFGIWRGGHGAQYLAAVDGAARDAGIEVWVVPGNHEDYDLIDELPLDGRGRAVAAPSVRLLGRGDRFDLDGVTFVAVGGAVSVDRGSRVPGRSWWAQEALSAVEEERIVAAAVPTDVMLLHDAPWGAPLPLPPPSARARQRLGAVLADARAHRERVRRIVDAHRPTWILHGHYHVAYQGRLRTPGFTSEVVGLDQDGRPLNLALATTDRFRGLVDWEAPLSPGGWSDAPRQA